MQDDTKHSGDEAQQSKANSKVGQAGPDQIGVSNSLNKEAEPIGTGEYLTPSTPELILPEEVDRIGVRVSTDHPRLTEKDRALGIKPAGESALVPSASSSTVKFTMSDEEIEEALKVPPSESRRFRGELANLIRQRIHEGLLKALRIGG